MILFGTACFVLKYHGELEACLNFLLCKQHKAALFLIVDREIGRLHGEEAALARPVTPNLQTSALRFATR